MEVNYKNESITLNEESGTWEWKSRSGRSSCYDVNLNKVKTRIDQIKRKKAKFQPVQAYRESNYGTSFSLVTITSVIDGEPWLTNSAGEREKASGYSETFYEVNEHTTASVEAIRKLAKEVNSMRETMRELQREMPKIDIRKLEPKEELIEVAEAS